MLAALTLATPGWRNCALPNGDKAARGPFRGTRSTDGESSHSGALVGQAGATSIIGTVANGSALRAFTGTFSTADWEGYCLLAGRGLPPCSQRRTIRIRRAQKSSGQTRQTPVALLRLRAVSPHTREEGRAQ